MLKSFLVWAFTLTVCLLVVGFPLVAVVATIGLLLSIVLESVIPLSAVLIVAGSLIGFKAIGVIAGAAILTLNGIHPQKVMWLNWLHGETEAVHTSVYATCPLTCVLE